MSVPAATTYYRGAFVLGGFLTGGLFVRWLLSGGFLPGAFDLEPPMPYPLGHRGVVTRLKRAGLIKISAMQLTAAVCQLIILNFWMFSIYQLEKS